MKSPNEKSLVSVIVVTYNSGKFVTETLESIKNQSYQNIELIITDDSSTDDTLSLCKVWIDNNTKRFNRVCLLTNPINTGISPNCNRGLFESRGDWVKLIAGDDILLPDCIKKNIDHIPKSNSNIAVLNSNMSIYRHNFESSSFIRIADRSKHIFNNRYIYPKEQLAFLVRGYGLLAPTSFFKRDIIVNLGGFDETLPYEDGPMWVKLASNGYNLFYFNDVTVSYRFYDSYSNKKKESLLFNEMFQKDYIVYRNVYRKHLNCVENFFIELEYRIKKIFYKKNLAERNTINSFLYKAVTIPSYIVRKFSLFFIVVKIKLRLKYEKVG